MNKNNFILVIVSILLVAAIAGLYAQKYQKTGGEKIVEGLGDITQDIANDIDKNIQPSRSSKQ